MEENISRAAGAATAVPLLTHLGAAPEALVTAILGARPAAVG
jgi:hypothetical protein